MQNIDLHKQQDAQQKEVAVKRARQICFQELQKPEVKAVFKRLADK